MTTLSGSPALNAGDNTSAPATDQRGLPRIAGPAIDIGAFEDQSQLSPTETYVVHLYRDVLGRAPGGALQLWVAAFDSV